MRLINDRAFGDVAFYGCLPALACLAVAYLAARWWERRNGGGGP